MDQLSPQDAQFLYMETGNNLVHVTCVNIYDPSTVPWLTGTTRARCQENNKKVGCDVQSLMDQSPS